MNVVMYQEVGDVWLDFKKLILNTLCHLENTESDPVVVTFVCFSPFAFLYISFRIGFKR